MTLEGKMYLLCAYPIDIPNLQAVHLPSSFNEVEVIKITSIDFECVVNSPIDVSPLLADLVEIRDE